MLWNWAIDSLALNIAVELHLLDDDEIVVPLFGYIRGLSNLGDDDKDKFFLRTAKYISYITVLFFY